MGPEAAAVMSSYNQYSTGDTAGGAGSISGTIHVVKLVLSSLPAGLLFSGMILIGGGCYTLCKKKDVRKQLLQYWCGRSFEIPGHALISTFPVI